MKLRLIDVLAFISTACAVTVTARLILNAQTPVLPTVDLGSGTKPVLLENWEALADVGHQIGDSSAPITIVEFSDFECPFCGEFARNQLEALRERYPSQVRFVFRHWPLPNHRLAYPAARAAECAGRQGRFWEYHDALFAAQDSLGLVSFERFADRARIPDLDEFEECLDDGGPVPAIERDIQAVQAIEGKGTPTIVVNGWRLRGTPSIEMLDSIIRTHLDAKR